MPPRVLSRFALSAAITANKNHVDPAKREVLILTDRVPYRFKAFADNRHHRVVEGDTLWTLADRYFPSVGDSPAMLYWVIADFQPDPIHDPTLELEPGRVLVIPSARTVREEVLAEKRRED